jgi:hypothetical protein
MSVEQIRYSHYRQKLEPGHEDYWEVIDLLASNIGTRLESHGIRVSQTKEKYGRAVVYLQGGLRNADQRRAYHEVYAQVIAEHPQYRSAILSGADWPLLAQPTAEDLERCIKTVYGEATASPHIEKDIRQARAIHKKRNVHGQARTDGEDPARGVRGGEEP